MSLLSYNELCQLVEANVITGVEPECINGTSIDVHLGPSLIIESYNDNRLHPVDIAKRTMWSNVKIDISNHAYELMPSEFVLASTRETFNLPNDISAEFRLKSSGARSGLNNLFACHCDPGWHGSALTLELKNELRYHAIRLTDGMPIGQMLFHRVTPVPADKDYAARGRYNKDAGAQAVKA
jgi:dCTP deaminase